jgi:hypothetical protein
MNTPSAEAIALAVQLSGHTHCQQRRIIQRDDPCGPTGVCDGCLGDARTIDEYLRLPQRNVVLMAAQGVVDTNDKGQSRDLPYALDTLRDALAAIKR